MKKQKEFGINFDKLFLNHSLSSEKRNTGISPNLSLRKFTPSR